MTTYLVMIIMLFCLAVAGLIVGVTNDAVNFLNSARGARVSKDWIILLVASLGVLIGTTFSSGMMEVARKGVFHPQQFQFSEIMIIYIAVMLTNVILLDTYNTMALPTSTTVSIVFSLMGSALAVSVMKLIHLKMPLNNLSQFINTDKAMAIIAGILLSVLVAFLAGSIIQFLTRLIFSFQYEKTLSRFGAVWGGLCISFITYFLLIKGAGGASFMSASLKSFIKENTGTILLLSFFSWTLLIQLLRWAFKISIPKMIIIIGTFSLAFAFAGNDLVNFIGVPLAGFHAFTHVTSLAAADPNSVSMNFMSDTIQTETYLLLISGAIMILTLWFSKKSQHVSQTELNIACQDIGEERFASTGLSRSVVHSVVVVSDFFRKLIPEKIRYFVERRLSNTNKCGQDEAQSFDLIRASMNLTIASSLIALGTSFELPLSTTYVTFMVSMGTSLADRAWGRESAVYRIAGVFTVIGGWFLTAIIAMTVSMIFSFLIDLGGIVVITALFILASYILYRTFTAHRKKQKNIPVNEKESDILNTCNQHTCNILLYIPELLGETIETIHKADRKAVRQLMNKANDLLLDTKNRKNHFTLTLRHLDEDHLEYGQFYLQMLHYVREFSHCIEHIIHGSYDHILNNHRPVIDEQYQELNELTGALRALFFDVAREIETQDFGNKDKIKRSQAKLLDRISILQSRQVKRVKNGQTNTRNTLLYMTLLFGIRDLLVHVLRLLKVQSKFSPENIRAKDKQRSSNAQIDLPLD